MRRKENKAKLEVFVGLFHNQKYKCNMGNGFQLITTPTLQNQVHVEINMVKQVYSKMKVARRTNYYKNDRANIGINVMKT